MDGPAHRSDHRFEPFAQLDGTSGQGDDEESHDEADDVSFESMLAARRRSG